MVPVLHKSEQDSAADTGRRQNDTKLGLCLGD